MVAEGPKQPRPVVARVRLKDQMDAAIPPHITKLRCVPKKIKGRLELHWYGVDAEGEAIPLDRDCITHSPQEPVTNPVILDQQP